MERSQERAAASRPYTSASAVDLFEVPPHFCESGRFNKSHIWVEEKDFYCYHQGPPPTSESKRTGEKAVRKKRGKSSASTVIIGFDTEYKTPDAPVTNDDVRDGKAKYEVLSYQFACSTEDGCEWSGICCPERGERITLGEYLVFALGKGIREKHVNQLPTTIYLVGHFTRADIPAFADFKDLQHVLSNVRNTFMSVDKGIVVSIKFPDGKTIDLQVLLRDTMVLSPATSKSLLALGEIVGRPKITLDPDPVRERWMKKNMDYVRNEHWDVFKPYAVNDAVICVEYAKKMLKLHKDVAGKAKIPVTLTSIGVELLLNTWKHDLNVRYADVLGKELVEEARWHDRLGRFIKRTLPIDLEEVSWQVGFVTECYHGGRNEQFWFGPGFVDTWTDWDLSSAYPTAMSMIGLPDWRQIKLTADLCEFTATSLGFACVDFEFPATVRYPTLPVRTSNGLVFPRKGRSCCAAPEIALALHLGAKLTIKYGVLVPTDPNVKIFGEFIRDCLSKRRAAESAHGKKSIDALFWKEISNSTYGKTAQGLRQKRVYDMRDRDTKPLPESRITNAFFAAHITSFVRAVLGEIINALPTDVVVFSCTTDGFLTNATDAQIRQAQSGSLCQLFSGARATLTDSSAVLEAKHCIRQPLGWRTRGQATLVPGPTKPDDSTFHIVLAKSGIYTPQDLDTAEQRNKSIVDLFLCRRPEQQIHVTAKTGIRDIVERDADFVDKDITRRLNMEYDWKRRPIATGDCASPRHLVMSTEPWETVEHFRAVRDLWQDFQRRTPTCLKTESDYRKFARFANTIQTLAPDDRKYLRMNGGVPADIARLRLSLCTAWRKSMGGLTWHAGASKREGLSAAQFALLLTECGIPCERSHVEAGLKREFKPNACPPTDACIEALARLKKLIPSLERAAFVADALPAITLPVGNAAGCRFVAKCCAPAQPVSESA